MANDTTVTKKEVTQEELNDILGTPGPGADNVMVPTEEKPNVFTRKKVDLNYLNEEEKPAAKPATTITPAGTVEATDTTTEDAAAIVDAVANTDFTGAKEPSTKANMSDVIKALVKKGKLVPFDDDKPVEEYTTKDYEELLEANFQDKETKIRQQVPIEFFDSLPEELKVAAKYVADGGQDMKGLFRALSQAEEVISMDATDPKNHEQIVRQFLTTTGFGTPEEIDEEIVGLRDRDELEKKAGQFKPKLDKMQEAMIGQKLAQQEQMQAQQAAAAKAYVGNIYKTLEPGELNGIKVDRKTQELLYSGLVQARYPSISGKPTNLFGHLIEKFQYVEPDHARIAEALWLLADPDGYKSKLMEKGKNTAVEKTVRMLRTEESNKTPGSTIVDQDEASVKRIPKTSPNFFKRA
jgi:translation elongation factor EF-Ts